MVVVSPLPAGRELIGELGPETQLVDLMGHGVFFVIGEVEIEVVLQIVRVHVPSGKAAAWRNVEIAHDLVYPDNAFETATLAALGINSLRVVLALTLFDVLSAAKGPLFQRVCFANLLASVTTARSDGVRWGWGAAAFTAVRRVEVFGVIAGVASEQLVLATGN